MVARKKRRNNCERQGRKHVLRFLWYIGERDWGYPTDHVHHAPKIGVFKCCNCGHIENRGVKNNWHHRPYFGDTRYMGGDFYKPKQKDKHGRK